MKEQLPSKRQLEFMDWEWGVFFHFGIRTFYEGHLDWDMQEMSLDVFNPTELDCRSWIDTIAKAGASYAVLVCKHHDGFANWPSQFTNYSIAHTPYRHGAGDIVKDFTDACHEYGIKIGLYYSPAEFGSAEKGSKDYDEYFINQISELLGNYGKIDYLWFDGCGSESHQYDTVRIVNHIRSMQPDLMIFNMWDPDVRWIGNEDGLAPVYNWNVVGNLNISVRTDEKDIMEQKRFLPAECDFTMRERNWFYSETDESTVKSVEELLGIYDYSVGRGANMLLNIGPDRRGLLPQKDAQHLLTFGERLRERFASPFPCAQNQNKNGYEAEFEDATFIGVAVLHEDLTCGQTTEEFEIKIHPLKGSTTPITVYIGKTVGHKRICEFPPVRTKKVEILCKGNLSKIEFYGIN